MLSDFYKIVFCGFRYATSPISRYELFQNMQCYPPLLALFQWANLCSAFVYAHVPYIIDNFYIIN